MTRLRILSLLLTLVVVMSATACGKKEPTTDPDSLPSIEKATAAIAAEDYETAYTYLLDIEGAEADELLKKFVFVKTSEMTEYDYGTTTERYTYDEKGNFLSATFVSTDGQETTSFLCTYDEVGRLLSSHSAADGRYADPRKSVGVFFVLAPTYFTSAACRGSKGGIDRQQTDHGSNRHRWCLFPQFSSVFKLAVRRNR